LVRLDLGKDDGRVKISRILFFSVVVKGWVIGDEMICRRGEGGISISGIE